MSYKCVRFLKTDSKARYQGYTFFFKEGLCWIYTLNENSEHLKARIKECSINDVNAMALYPFADFKIPNEFYVVLLNSYFAFLYKKHFINGSSAFQINDARQLPIVIPTKEQVARCLSIFERATKIKKIGIDSSNDGKMQDIIDSVINNLYFI